MMGDEADAMWGEEMADQADEDFDGIPRSRVQMVGRDTYRVFRALPRKLKNKPTKLGEQ